MKLPYDGQVRQPSPDADSFSGGYQGRVAVIEALDISPDIKDGIMQQFASRKILQIATEEGYLTLEDDAYIKMLRGMTSLDEVERVV